MRIGQVGLVISDELTEQARALRQINPSQRLHLRLPFLKGKLLGELEDDVDGTMSRLKAATVRAQFGVHPPSSLLVAEKA
jgi:hypothetical protein